MRFLFLCKSNDVRERSKIWVLDGLCCGDSMKCYLIKTLVDKNIFRSVFPTWETWAGSSLSLSRQRAHVFIYFMKSFRYRDGWSSEPTDWPFEYIAAPHTVRLGTSLGADCVSGRWKPSPSSLFSMDWWVLYVRYINFFHGKYVTRRYWYFLEMFYH